MSISHMGKIKLVPFFLAREFDGFLRLSLLVESKYHHRHQHPAPAPKENQTKATCKEKVILSPENSEEEDDCSQTDTVMLEENDKDQAFDEASVAPASVDVNMKINKKLSLVIIKAVTGRIPEPEELHVVKLLKGKFQAPPKSLKALTVTQLLEVTARKLISLKYVTLKSGIGSGDIRNTDVTVHKEIQM